MNIHSKINNFIQFYRRIGSIIEEVYFREIQCLLQFMVINYQEIMPSTQITLYIFKALRKLKLIANKLLI